MTRPVSLTVRARIGDNPGPEVTVRGREAWALLALMAAEEQGCTPTDTPGPRWSGYLHDLRKLRIVIDTARERHGGRFPGDHARYVLPSRITILHTLGAAA
jgi:winged helix domain-containing protein